MAIRIAMKLILLKVVIIANFLSDRTGKGGAHYGPFGGFCLETQHYPDAINQPAFPSPVLRQGEQLHETTIYRFRVRK